MSFSSNIYLPPPSPAQLARLAKEREELEDLFGDLGDADDDDTTSHTNAYSRVVSPDNASNTVVNSGTRTNHGGPLVNYINNSPLNLQNTNISTFNTTAGDNRSNYQATDNHNYMSQTWQNYQQQQHNGMNVNGLSQYIPQPMSSQVGGYVQSGVNMPLPATQTQTQIQTPLPSQGYMPNHSTIPQKSQPGPRRRQEYSGFIPNAPASIFTPDPYRTLPAIQTQTRIQTPLPSQKDRLNRSTIPKNSQSKRQKYTGPIPNAPASIFTPYSAGVDGNDFRTMTASPGVQLVNGKLVSYDRFMGQAHDVTIPDPVSLQDGAISLEGMAAAAYYFHKDQLHYNDAVRFSYNLNLQPEFVEGNSKGDSSPVLPERLDHSSPHMHSGTSEMSQGAFHPTNTSKLPPVTSDGQSIPYNSFHNILPTRSKRPREEDVDTSPPVLSAPPRKRRYRRSAQSHTPSLPANAQTTPLPVFSGMNLQQRKTVPPYVALGPETYMCNYLGPAVPNEHGICGSLIKSSTRNRDRHMGNHAEDEEGLISSGAISRDAVHALLWVQPRVFKCAVSGCNYSISVWRMDDVRRKHEEEQHPELVQKSKKGKGKARNQEECG